MRGPCVLIMPNTTMLCACRMKLDMNLGFREKWREKSWESQEPWKEWFYWNIWKFSYLGNKLTFFCYFDLVIYFQVKKKTLSKTWIGLLSSVLLKWFEILYVISNFLSVTLKHVDDNATRFLHSSNQFVRPKIILS